MGHVTGDLAFPREWAAEQWEINVLKTSLLLNISASPENEGADRELVAPTLKVTISWLKQAAGLKAADKTQAGPLRGQGERDRTVWKGMIAHPPRQSCQALAR